jgi:hypothetical protein
MGGFNGVQATEYRGIWCALVNTVINLRFA